MSMWAILLGGLLFPFTITSASLFKRDPPIPNEGDQTWLSPRVITYFAYFFPPRESLSSRTVAEDSDLVRNHHLFPKKLPIYDQTINKTILRSTLNWADILKTDWVYQATKTQTTRTKAAEYFWANPAYRKTEYAGDEICGSSYIGQNDVKIVQLLTDPGFPVEVPIFSCKKEQTGLVNAFFVISKRDFMDDLKLIERYEIYEHDARRDESVAVSYPAQLLQAIYYPLLENWPNSSAFLQSGVRDAGGQIWQKSNTYNTGSGQLQLAPLSGYLHEFDNWLPGVQSSGNRQKFRRELMKELMGWFGWGITLQVGTWKSGDVKDSEIIVNIDTLLKQRPNDDRTDKQSISPTEDIYSSYEKWNSRWDLNETFDKYSNLRLDISWDDWSCCSTCCCPKKMCGVMETQKHCYKVKSIKTRKGYLSLKKIDEKEPIDLTKILINIMKAVAWNSGGLMLTNLDKLQSRLEKMFEVSPYREKGIPLYSTIIPVEFRRSIVQDYFEPKFLIARKWTKSSEAYTGLGLFVSTASCDNEQQKKDCYHLAKCRGIQLIDERERITDVVKMEKDPCWDVPFITLTIDEPKNWLKLERGQHYRIHLTENVFNSKNVSWKVGKRRAIKYKNTTVCKNQGIVSYGNFLLFTNSSKMDDVLKIEATLENGQIVQAILSWKETEKEAKEEEDNESKILWIVLGIGGGLIILIMFLIVLDHHLLMKKRKENITPVSTARQVEESPKKTNEPKTFQK